MSLPRWFNKNNKINYKVSVLLTALGNSVMVDIAWCKIPQKFFVLSSYYGNWNQLSSCYLSQRVDDYVLGHVSRDVTACPFQHDQELVL